MILAVFSIFFGFITKDMFIGLGSGFFSDNALFIHPSHEIMLDTEFGVPTLFKLLPLVFTISLSVIAIVLSEYLSTILIYFKLSRVGYNIFSFFNQRFLIELFYNRYITGIILKLGGQTTKVLDKGSVEYIGPYGLEKGLLNISNNIAKLSTGVITSYALYTLIGLIVYLLSYSYINSSIFILALCVSLSLVSFKNSIDIKIVYTSSISPNRLFFISFIAFTNIAITAKILFAIFKANSQNDNITIVALLLISIMLTLAFGYISSKLRRTSFVLRLPTIIFLLVKLSLIVYIIVNCAIDLHIEIMPQLIDFFLNYIVTMYLGNELIALGMNGPNPGWVNSTGADFGGNNPNPVPTGQGVRMPYIQDTLGRWLIRDSEGVCLKTRGRFIRGYDYGKSEFFKNASTFLGEKRSASEIPAGLHPTQEFMIKTLRHYHCVHVEGQTAFNPDIHKYNTGSFRNWLNTFEGNTP